MLESTLVVEEKPKVRKHISEIMGFMGHASIITVEAKDCSEQFNDKNRISLVLLSDCGSSRTLQSVFRDIRIADSHVPIIQISNPGNSPRFSQELELLSRIKAAPNSITRSKAA